MRARFAGMLVGLVLSATVLSCGGSGDGGNGPGGNSLLISPASLSIADCGPGAISAVVKNGDGIPVSAVITFSSDDTAVASVDASGNVTGQGPGATSITVVAGSLQKAIPVAVAASPATLSVSDSLLVHPQQSVSIGAGVTDCHGDPTGVTVSYSGIDGNVATISAGGAVTGVAYGSTTVTVTAGPLVANVPIKVIGRPTGASSSPVLLNASPFGVAISNNGVVYVTRIASNTVGRGTIPLNGFSGSITVGNTAAHVAMNPAGTLAYVTNQSSNSVSVIDMATNLETTQIPLGNSAFNLIVSPNGQTLYATVDVGTVYVINTGTNAIADSFAAGPVANGLAFSPDGTRLYVSSRNSGWVVVYDTLSNTMIDTLQTGGSPQRLAVSADGTELYIANEQLGLDIWSLTSATRITNILMEGYGLALSPDNSVIYVSNPSSGQVTIVDRALRQVIGTLITGGTPRNIAFSRFGVEGLIANEAGYVTVAR